MKKIMMIVALAIGFGYAAHAQVTTKTTTTETTTRKVSTDHVKIDKNSLPVRTLEKIGASYGGHEIVEAHKSSTGEFKLVLRKDGKDKVAYFNKKGEFLRED